MAPPSVAPAIQPASSPRSVTAPQSGWGDPIYQAAVSADWRSHRLPPHPYAIFQEMEDKDTHLYSALQTRKLAILAGGWTLEPGDPTDPRAREAHRLCEEILAASPDFDNLLMHLLDALGKGLALAEIEWQIQPARRGHPPRVVPARLVGQWPADFAFDRAGRLHRLPAQHAIPPLSSGQNTDLLMPRPGEAYRPSGGQPVAHRKFISYAFQGSPAQPYGVSLCLKCYWYAFFKKHTLKFWSLFNERFGSPTAVARYSSTATSEEVARLEELLTSLQTDSGIILPEGISLELLEAGRSAAGSTHRELADWCNDEMSKAILGQTLTMGEGRRAGSLALGRIHNEVRREYIAADARSLAAAVSRSLLRWITDFNLGESVPSPRLRFAAERQTDPAEDLALDERLVKLGVPLPVDWFHQRYGRPVPAAEQRVLRYDDSNLYQYHLQFGILRINEVRASLGLPPVPWGDAPPQNLVGGAPVSSPRPSTVGSRETNDADRTETTTNESLNDRRTK
jgi:hypothetical protein